MFTGKMSVLQCRKCVLQFIFRRKLQELGTNEILLNRQYATKLYTIGKLLEPNHETDEYKPGQLFIHKTFSYRGVILHPWQARLYDRDKTKTKDTTKSSTTEDVKPLGQSKRQLYYQVLVDGRDIPHVRVENPCASYLQRSFSTQLIVIPGIDYVSHEDIVPIVSTEKPKPIHHKWFDKFLAQDMTVSELAYEVTDELRTFQENNYTWLCLSKVYRETTDKIQVTVIPFYMGKVESYNQYWWRYCIRIENLGDTPVQLRERFLMIHSTPVSYEKLRARGVIGKEPKLTEKSPTFQYNSHVPLESSSGFMRGTFTFEKPDGNMFEVKIPVVNLEKVEDPNNHEDDVSS